MILRFNVLSMDQHAVYILCIALNTYVIYHTIDLL